MAVPSVKGPIVDPGLCRCCGSIKKCRVLNEEYEFCGEKEIYSDMFFDCFGLLLSHLDRAQAERLICATCVTRLRDATAFRKQVLICEQTLLQVAYEAENERFDIKSETNIKQEAEDNNATRLEDVQNDTNHYIDDADSGSLSSEPLINLRKKTRKKKKDKLKTRKKHNRESLDGDCDGIKEKKLRHLIDKKYYVFPEIGKKVASKSRTGSETKSYLNTITIVENSFVCPFDTSFSDYFCIYCRNVYTDPDKLREHTLTHDPTSFKTLAINKKLILLDVYRVDCRLCQKTINNVESLKTHLVDAHSMCFDDTKCDFVQFRLTVTNLRCTECDASFSFFHALKKHMAEHFGNCICDVCGAHYFEERMLALHQKSHRRIDESFPCHCGKVFKSKHSRYLHETKIHKKEPVFQCSKCDQVFFSYSIRYRHMMEAHGEHRVFPCEYCDRAYVSRKSLREHNRRYHLKIFKHQCDLCEKRFYLPSRLKEHMATHTGERNFRCEYCGKSYPRLRGLKVHMQSHSTEKKFRCSICNATFTQNVNLKNHVKRQHQDVDIENGYHVPP